VVRSTHSAYEHAQRASREATHRFETAVTELALLTLQHAELNTRLAGAETAERTLADSPEMRTAEEIRLAGEAALAANKTLAETETDERNAISSAEQALSRQNLAEEKFAGFERESISKLHAASLAASAADLALAHQKHLPAEISDFRFPSAAETGLTHALAQRSKSLKLLTAREQAVTNSARDLAAAEEALRQAESAESAARAEEHTARENLEAVGATLFTSYASWQVAVWHLRPAESSSLADAFDAWLEQRDGPSPLRRAAESAHHQAVAVFAAREHTLILAATELTQNIAELDAEITRLENGETAPPPPPLTRRADRANRPGAPLWLVCDFHPEFPPASRAGLEAALQSAGLVDAWILPDGQLLAGDEDTFIVLSDSEISNPGSKITPRLCDLLIPAIDPESSAARQLSAETVSRLLSRIGGAPGESSHWVADNGAWQLGPLSGRWSKPEADFIGESTRAAARRRQLTISRARRDEANAALQENRSALARLAENRTAAATEFSAAPAEEPIVLAGYLLGTATGNVATTLLAAERAVQTTNIRRSEWEQHRKTLQTDAADLQLTAWLGRLEELGTHTQHYATLLAALWPTLKHGETIAAQLAFGREQSAVAEAALASRRHRREQAALADASARQRFQTLQETHGQAVTVILEKHTAAKAAVTALKTQSAMNEGERIVQTSARATSEEKQTSAEQKRIEQETLRHNAIVGLRQLATQRLLVDADPAFREHDADEEWSVARAVDIARDIDNRLADTAADQAAWQQRQDQIHGHIQDLRDRLITHGHQSETHQIEKIVLVSCVFQARPHTMTELHAAFLAEIESRERLLQESEREIIENHLLAEAAVELQN